MSNWEVAVSWQVGPGTFGELRHLSLACKVALTTVIRTIFTEADRINCEVPDVGRWWVVVACKVVLITEIGTIFTEADRIK